MGRPQRRAAGFFAVAALALAFCAEAAPARAQSAYCDDLRARIARAGDADAGRYRAAAVRQRGEYNRTAAYAHSLGCDRQQFLFFGDSPPAQCGALNARLGQMRANLGALERSGGMDPGGGDLRARYDGECRGRAIQTRARPRNLFEELFGVAPPESGNAREIPVDPSGDPLLDEDGTQARTQGGNMAICVRACDGGFFPVSYSARRSNLDQLADLCRALCPNAETTLYTRTQSGDLNNAVSLDGSIYADHPNALKFQKSFDAACTCKPPGKSWSEALEEAEQILAANNSKDEVITAERAEQLSRPSPIIEQTNRRRQKPGLALEPPPPVVAPGPSEAAADKNAAPGPEVFREVVGPDGVKRKVRVVAPTL